MSASQGNEEPVFKSGKESESSQAETRKVRRTAHPKLWLAFVLVLVGVISAAAMALSISRLWADREDQIWLLIAEYSMQGLVVVALGGVVSAVLRRWEVERESSEARHEIRTSLLKQFLSAYFQCKACRRRLRIAGWVGGAGQAEGPQKEVLHSQIEELNDVQLELEGILHTIRTSEDCFQNVSTLKSCITSMEEYLREIISEYELAARSGKEITDVAVSLEHLFGFTEDKGGSVGDKFKVGFLIHKDSFLHVLRKDVLARN